ncbi:MAG TPA: HD domain-containing phosphohydrolase [Actinomycetota bacterium]|nr:HD domain-containing phosphohydrolase [Actinomycetota bacterium]
MDPSLRAVEEANSSMLDASLHGPSDLLASTADSLRGLIGAEDVAIYLAGETEPVFSTSEGHVGTPASKQHVLQVPLTSGADKLGHIVLRSPLGAQPFGQPAAVMASLLAGQLALGLGRAEALNQARASQDDARRAQTQLEAYARDIRSTFKAEKERANQLAAALRELEETYLATVKGMSAAVEAKDEYTLGHLVRVTRYGLAMVKVITGEETPERHYEEGFLLHDIGKLAIPDAILKKTGSLDDIEWQIMRTHVEIGFRILQNIPFLSQAREIVLAHHERWDGKGYPLGLGGDLIPLGARLFPVADSFDAMTSDRPYRAAISVEEAFRELEKGSGTQFWGDAVEAFLSLPHDEIEAIARTRDESLLAVDE